MLQAKSCSDKDACFCRFTWIYYTIGKDKADDDGVNLCCHFAFDEKDERGDILKSLGLEY
ncbi:hypothetical protein ACVQ90_00315 [Staphylococcus aureus]